MAALAVAGVLLRQGEHPAGALQLGHAAAARNLRQTAAVEGAAALIHGRIGPGRVPRELPPGEIRALHQGG